MVAVEEKPAGESASSPTGYVSWRINGERVVLLGWGAGILLLLAHPLVAAGVSEHSVFATDLRGYLRRLMRTVDATLALTFGSPARAARAARGINAAHDRVNGTLGAAAGTFEAGTAYSARDPALLLWVHAITMDMLPRAYELYVGPLTPAERASWLAEQREIGVMLGIPRGDLPTSEAELRAYMDGMLAGGAVEVSPVARALAPAVLRPPLPWPARSLTLLLTLPMIGLLPPTVRDGYGLRWGPRHEAALRASAWIVRRLLPLLPPALRYWPVARRARRRAG